MRTDDLDTATNEQRDEEKIKEVSQSHPQWESELARVIHNAKPQRVIPVKSDALVVNYRKWWSRWMAFVIAKQNAGCRSCESSSGIAVDVQQRLNCALPSFSLKLWFLSIPKSSRHIQELSIDWLLELAVDLFNRSPKCR